jgi:hypothetical protein
MEIRNPGQKSPLLETRFLQNPDAGRIVLEDDRKKVLNSQARARRNRMADERRRNSPVVIFSVYVIAELGREPERGPPRPVGAQTAPSGRFPFHVCYEYRMRPRRMIVEPCLPVFDPHRLHICGGSLRLDGLIVDFHKGGQIADLRRPDIHETSSRN